MTIKQSKKNIDPIPMQYSLVTSFNQTLVPWFLFNLGRHEAWRVFLEIKKKPTTIEHESGY